MELKPMQVSIFELRDNLEEVKFSEHNKSPRPSLTSERSTLTQSLWEVDFISIQVGTGSDTYAILVGEKSETNL